MPGKRWRGQEKTLLHQQVNDGVPLAAIEVPQRTMAGIAYQLRCLKIYPTSRWTKAEVCLLRQEATAGKPPWKIMIPGRSPQAVRNKILRLRLWTPKSRTQKPWMRTELNRLWHFVIDCGYTARQAVANGYFPGRTIDSVAQQMRRCGWKRFAFEKETRRTIVPETRPDGTHWDLWDLTPT